MVDPVKLKTVCAGESKDIKKRREKAKLSSHDVEDSLIGVALSGGASRSASFSLGVVQALQRIGLWKYIDYMSTVSGGGYIGSYLTSSTLRNRQPMDTEESRCFLNEKSGDRQKPKILRFIYGGRYLIRPWKLANSFLLGLVGINLAVFSGVVSLASLIAFLWRCLDYPFISDRLAIVLKHQDFSRAFFPFYVFAISWLIAWLISIFKRSGDAQGDVARYLLMSVVASLFIGIALLLGNGDVAGWNDVVAGRKSLSFGGKIWGPIIALILGGLLPFLSPKRLLKSGLNPEQPWERYVFNAASTALLIGLPLVIVGVLARENISGFNTEPERPIVRGDIDDMNLLCILLAKDGTPPVGNNLLASRAEFARIFGNKHLKPLPPDQRDEIKKMLVQDEEQKSKQLSGFFEELRVLYDKIESPEKDSIKAELDDLETNPKYENLIVFARKLKTIAERTNPVPDLPPDESNTEGNVVDLISKYVVKVENAKRSEDNKLRSLSDLASKYIDLKKNETLVLSKFFGDDVKANDLANRTSFFGGFGLNVLPYVRRCIDYVTNSKSSSDYWNARAECNFLENHICVVLNRYLADAKILEQQIPKDSIETTAAATSVRQEVGATPGSVISNSQPSAAYAKRRRELVEKIGIVGIGQLTTGEVRELNRLLLEFSYPDIFRERHNIRRVVSIDDDQKARLGWFIFAGSVFFLAGMWIDLNSISTHRYYRDCLAEAFIVGRSSKSPSISLSEMDTTEFGAPYHLLAASVGVRPDRKDLTISDNSEDREDEERYERGVDSFLFSRLYCGSELTGYLDTSSYEHHVVGYANRIDLAEATAISGAALSPGHIRNWLLAFLMFAMNLSMGQWVPNPRARKPRYRPRVFTLLWSLLQKPENRPYCYVSDGGHSENLGIVELLKRRCKLIIAVDVSHDPQHQFRDLTRAIRVARMHHGVKMISIDKDVHGNEKEFDLSDLQLDSDSMCKRHFVMASIQYEDNQTGLMVYLKPSFDGDESADLKQFRKLDGSFPHNSTTEQVFDEAQVESYRYLGYHIGMRLQDFLPPEYRVGELWDCSDVDAECLIDWIVSNRNQGSMPRDSKAIGNPVEATDEDIQATRPLAKQILARVKEEFPQPADIDSSRCYELLKKDPEFEETDLIKSITALQCAVLDKKQVVSNREYCVWLLKSFENDAQIPTNLSETIEMFLVVAQPGNPDRLRIAAITSLAILGRGKEHRESLIQSLEQLKSDEKASVRLVVKNALSNLHQSPRKPR